MVEMIGRMLRWIVGKIGSGTMIGFCLLLVMLSSLVLWLNQNAQRIAETSLWMTTLLALAFGWSLARSKLPTGSAAILAMLSGLITVSFLSGGLLGRIVNLAQAVFLFIGSRLRWQSLGARPERTLVLALARDLGLGLTDLIRRVMVWLNGLWHGSPGYDALVVGLVWGCVLWIVSVWSAWGLRRRGQPLMAALPAVGVLATSLAFARGQPLYLVISFCAVLGLLAWSQYNRQATGWEQRGIDRVTDIPYDLILWTGSIAVVVGVLAVVLATPSPHQAVRFARSLLITRSQTAESFGESLGHSPSVAAGQPGGAASVLPRQHLLGSGPELSQRVVYLIQVLASPSDRSQRPGYDVDSAVGRYYWRMVTYDQYDGRGWKSSPTTVAFYPAESELPLPAQPGAHRWIEQEVQMVGEPDLQVLQTGNLFRLDEPFTVDLRRTPPDELDPFGARFQQGPEAGHYRAVSQITTPDTTDLARSTFDYPGWIAERYLSLPSGLPPRVAELARQITAGIKTPYGRARLLEAYLQAHPYTLDLTSPPPDRDVVDYYLFDLKRGYCDYSATAMAVMARTMHLPSRLVVGYAPGHYDASSGRTVITEADAHSWPEIYFSGVGWVEFEPTGGFPTQALPVDQTSPSIAESPAQTSWLNSLSLSGKAWLIIYGLVLLVLAIWGGQRLRSAHQSSIASLTLTYKSLRRFGRRLGAPDWPGMTPSEVGEAVEAQVKQLARPGWWEKKSSAAKGEALLLAEIYARAIYSPDTPEKTSVVEARRLWQRLRWRFWLVWLQSRFRR
jgi:hypothetical protein